MQERTRYCGWLAVLLGLATGGCGPLLGIEDTVVDPGVCALMPERVFFADKLVENTSFTIATVSQRRFADLAVALNAQVDSQRGHVLTRVVDCKDEPAQYADVSGAMDLAGTTKFIVAGDRLELGTSTSADGLAGLLNVAAPLEQPMTAYPDEIDPLPSSEGDIVSHAGEISFVNLLPNSEIKSAPPGADDEWDCVGVKPDPVVGASEITITVEVRTSSALAATGADSQPIAGARVTVCLDDGSACATNLDAALDPTREALTNANGRAQLVVSTGSEGFDGQILIRGTHPSCQ